MKGLSLNFMKKIERVNIHNEYIYMRTKDIIEDEIPNKLYLYAGLAIKEYRTLGTSVRKKVTPVHSELLEVPISKMPSFAKRIPNGTIGVEVTKKQFHILLTEAHEDPVSLFLFDPE